MKKLFLSLTVCSVAIISSCGDSSSQDERVVEEKVENVDELMRLADTSCYIETEDEEFRANIRKAVVQLNEKIKVEPDNTGPKLTVTWAYRMLGENQSAYDMSQSMLDLIDQNKEQRMFTKQIIAQEHAINCLLLNKAKEANEMIKASRKHRVVEHEQREKKFSEDSEELASEMRELKADLFVLEALRFVVNEDFGAARKRLDFPVVRDSYRRDIAEFLEGFMDDVESGKRKLDFVK